MRHPSPPHAVGQMSPHPMHGHMMPQMGPVRKLTVSLIQLGKVANKNKQTFWSDGQGGIALVDSPNFSEKYSEMSWTSEIKVFFKIPRTYFGAVVTSSRIEVIIDSHVLHVSPGSHGFSLLKNLSSKFLFSSCVWHWLAVQLLNVLDFKL